MSATMTSQTTGKKKCGCGCSGSKTNASCSCGCSGTDCATCQDQGYVRPLFFAGQLLTEDDLQQLTDYVVAKNRLRARYLAGSGVVCGLEVNCEPCDGGKVIVNPGYALDCCGNDIILSCPKTLDINQMVRELKIKLRGGYDCTDPCAGANTKTPCGETSTSGTQTSSTSRAQNGGLNPPPPPAVPGHKYCLYINYCEQPTDPVSPYATDAPCGPTTSCYPTRCLEAFRFELRCPDLSETNPPICDRIWNCIGDPTAYERVVKDSELLGYYSRRILDAWERLRETPIPRIELASHRTRLRDHTRTLEKSLGIVAEKHESVTDEELRSFIDAVSSVSRDVALSRIQPEAKERAEYKEFISGADSLLAHSLKAYRDLQEVLPRAFPTTLERAHVASLFELVEKISAAEDQPANRRALAAERPPITDPAIKLLALGAVFGPTFQHAAASSLVALRDWLINHLERSTQSCCGLLSEVLAVTIPSPTSSGEMVSVAAQKTGTAAETLTRAAQEVFRGCICNALNPPCPSCDDTGVLLACFTVENCKVTEICSAVRKFVLTPVNLRYWVPEIDHIGKQIAEWCCRCGCPEYDPPHLGRNAAGFTGFDRAPFYVRTLLRILCCECPKPNSSEDEKNRDCFSQLFDREPIFTRDVSAALSVADRQREVNEAVHVATATLAENLSAAIDELESFKQEHKKLLERMARFEKKHTKGQPEA